MFSRNISDKKNITKKSIKFLIGFIVIFLTLTISTIVLSIISSTSPVKTNDVNQIPTDASKDPSQVQTSTLYKNSFDLSDFKIKTALPSDWKGTMVTNDLGDVKQYVITLINNSNDRIELIFKKSQDLSNIKQINTGGEETFNAKDLKSIGNVFGKEMFRQTDIKYITDGQSFGNDYSFPVISFSKDNKFVRKFNILTDDVQITYYTAGKDFLIYNGENILSNFDKVLQTLSI